MNRSESPGELGQAAGPRAVLRRRDAVSLVVGIVIGAGIFRTPSLVAANAEGVASLLWLWAAGGAVSLVGALCYAELASAYPHAGGEYHYLFRAFGRRIAFLFGWARLTVIPTGSIALLAFIVGDYASELLPLGPASSAIHAATTVALLTGLNLSGVRQGTRAQNALTLLVVAGVVLVVAAGLWAAAPVTEVPMSERAGSYGLALVFVLLTYGGWNEAAYVSAELKGGPRSMITSLVISLGIVTLLYLLINVAYVRGLGLEALSASRAPAADLLERVAGPSGAKLIGLLVAAAALTSANATMLMGARAHYALGRDFPLFAALGQWSARAHAPQRAIALQGAISLLLVVLGALSRSGFETMVEYTAPVFWGFFLLTGVSLFVLRWREPHRPRPFRVPLYPLMPAAFCASSAYLLYASLAYTGWGALVGVGVLAAGALPMWWSSRHAVGNRPDN